jgi:hypothetical protein
MTIHVEDTGALKATVFAGKCPSLKMHWLNHGA